MQELNSLYKLLQEERKILAESIERRIKSIEEKINQEKINQIALSLDKIKRHIDSLLDEWLKIFILENTEEIEKIKQEILDDIEALEESNFIVKSINIIRLKTDQMGESENRSIINEIKIDIGLE